MDNPVDDKKEMSIEREPSTDTAPDKQSTSTKSKSKKIYFPLKISLCFHAFLIYLKSKKVDILLNATGNVPIMKKRKWAVEGNKPISSIMSFIHKYLKLDAEDKLVGFFLFSLVCISICLLSH